jgi:hypothetical protein
MNLAIEFEQEDDGRWIAEIPSLPGLMACGTTKPDAESKVEAMALRVSTNRILTSALAFPPSGNFFGGLPILMLRIQH